MSSITELKTIRDEVLDYFDKLAANLDDTANSLPSFEDYTTSLTYDNLRTDALLGSDKVANYTTGALVDTVHLAAAITREFAMRRRTKDDYINAGAVDASKVGDYMDELYGRYLNYLRGTAPEQVQE